MTGAIETTGTAKLPAGHILIDGRRYVALSLFEAANQHVLERGLYDNTLIGALNAVGQERRELRDANDRLRDELRAARAELEDCRRTQAAMRAAVYRAGDSL